jgi:uncharacterized iron-regulated protein
MQGHRVILLGEVHDNDAQHALRAAALRDWIATGARPAIAFEQFDRERQADIDRARRERPGDADYLIAHAGGGSGWRWASYRPFVALALEFDLPIVAANLSRTDAMRVATDGWAALFDASTQRALRLEGLPAGYLRKQQQAVAEGHCNQLPADQVPALVRAQAARDIMMARSVQPYADKGVVLLTGNGHARRDVGVRFWLSGDAQRQTISIGMLEYDDDPVAESAHSFDAYVLTARAARSDPCEELTRQLKRGAAR